MNQRASHEMDIDSWLGHKGSSGGNTGYLGNWKEDGAVEVVLHPRAGVAALWGHGWYRIADYESKKDHTRIIEVKSQRWNCLEVEAILQKQRYRDDKDYREYPPVTCPYCLALEHVRDLINDEQLSWVEPLFKFDPVGGTEAPLVIHAGAWCGLIGEKKKDEYSKEEIAELRQAGIRLDQVFLQNGFARLQYLLRVVAVKDPGAGCILTFEAQSLGDAVKKVIRDQIAEYGESGDMRRVPYAMLWSYDKNKMFSDKYDARSARGTFDARMKNPNPALVAALSGDPPSISEHVSPGNVRQLRASMEEHCLINKLMPWDEIFAPAMAIADEVEEEINSAKDSTDSRATSFDFGANKPPDPNPADDDEVACAACQGVMKASEDTCPHCGVVYDADGNYSMPAPKVPEPPAPRPMRTRGQPAAAPSGAPQEAGQAGSAPSRARAPSRRR